MVQLTIEAKTKQIAAWTTKNFIIPENLIDCINPQQEVSNPEASLELRDEEKTPNYAALS